MNLLVLSLIDKIYNRNNIRLYRDDGLAVFKNTSRYQSEEFKKTFKKCFTTKV